MLRCVSWGKRKSVRKTWFSIKSPKFHWPQITFAGIFIIRKVIFRQAFFSRNVVSLTQLNLFFAIHIQCIYIVTLSDGTTRSCIQWQATRLSYIILFISIIIIYDIDRCNANDVIFKLSITERNLNRCNVNNNNMNKVILKVYNIITGLEKVRKPLKIVLE